MYCRYKNNPSTTLLEMGIDFLFVDPARKDDFDCLDGSYVRVSSGYLRQLTRRDFFVVKEFEGLTRAQCLDKLSQQLVSLKGELALCTNCTNCTNRDNEKIEDLDDSITLLEDFARQLGQWRIPSNYTAMVD